MPPLSHEHHHRDQQRYEFLRYLCECSSLLGGTLQFPSTMLRSKDKTDHLLFQEVAGCATGSARLSQAPNFMESGFKASTYWVVSLDLYNYMSIPKMPSGYSRPRLAESAKIVHLCTALVCTGRCRFRARERGCWDKRGAPKRPTTAGASEDRVRESRGSCELLRTPLWRSSENCSYRK